METLQKTVEGRLLFVDIRNIIFDWNIRDEANYGNLQELADSLAAQGQAQPAKAKYDAIKKGYVLYDGHRRYKATMLNVEAGKFNVDTDKFKIVPVPADYTEKDRLLEMFCSNDSKPLEILEQAELVKRLKESGMLLKGISDKIGKPLTFVKNLDMLSEAPEPLKKKIASKKVSASTVIDLMKKESDIASIITLLDQAEFEAGDSIGSSGKITKKHIQKSKGIQTSLAYFKSIMNATADNVKPDKVEAFLLLRDIIEGKYNNLEMEKIFLI
jgi:hypothetical protein